MEAYDLSMIDGLGLGPSTLLDITSWKQTGSRKNPGQPSSKVHQPGRHWLHQKSIPRSLGSTSTLDRVWLWNTRCKPTNLILAFRFGWDNEAVSQSFFSPNGAFPESIVTVKWLHIPPLILGINKGRKILASNNNYFKGSHRLTSLARSSLSKWVSLTNILGCVLSMRERGGEY